ncbi:MAG: hypothetical protein CL743_03955 [Chloroflexi bacterium]|nr:hypothetical protein [Chloroflexota bacterium]
MNNYCSNCGSENKDQNNKFCGNCGMPISHADTLSTVFIPSRNPDLNRNNLSVTPYWKKVLSFQGTIRQRDYIFSFLGIIFVYAILFSLIGEYVLWNIISTYTAASITAARLRAIRQSAYWALLLILSNSIFVLVPALSLATPEGFVQRNFKWFVAAAIVVGITGMILYGPA